MMGLLAVGLCVLVVLAVRRVVRPKKLTLATSPGRPNSLSLAHILALFILYLATGSAAEILTGTEWRLLAWAASQLIWLAACLVLASMTFRLGLRRGLGLSTRHWVYDGFRAIVACLAVLPVCVALLVLTVYLFFWILPPEQAADWVQDHKLLEVLPALHGAWVVLPVLVAVVLAPLAEEVFFRGMVQSMLRRYTGRPWPAIVITSLFFAMMHLGTRQAVPSLFVLGVVLGYNYERSGRLYSPILIHALFNGVFVALRLSGSP